MRLQIPKHLDRQGWLEARLGRIRINRQPNIDLEVPLNVRYWGVSGHGADLAPKADIDRTMKTIRHTIIGLAMASGSVTVALAVAAEPLEKTKTILAAQLRDQGYDCDQPKSAARDIQASKPDEQVW